MRFKLFAVASLAAVVAVVAMLVGTAGASPAPSGASARSAGAAAAPVRNLPPVLYGNTSNDTGIAITAQNFESDFDAYDAVGADDFTVPAGHTWTIKQAYIGGQYYNGSGPARSVNVAVFTNAGGLPGAAVWSSSNVKVKDNAGSFQIKTRKLKLNAGTYWFAVQTNMDFSSGGQWGWENSANSVGFDAAWENPGDGFGTGCTTWNVEQTCIPSGQGPSKILVLYGKQK